MKIKHGLALGLVVWLLGACSGGVRPKVGWYFPKYPDTVERKFLFGYGDDCTYVQRTAVAYMDAERYTPCSFEVSGGTLYIKDPKIPGILWFGSVSDDRSEITESMAPRNTYIFTDLSPTPSPSLNADPDIKSPESNKTRKK